MIVYQRDFSVCQGAEKFNKSLNFPGRNQKGYATKANFSYLFYQLSFSDILFKVKKTE